MPLEVARHAVGSRTLIRVRLLDRRLARPVEDDFLFQHDVEQCLYGANNGALYQLYARCSLQSAPLSLKRSSVPALVTADELQELVSLLSEGLPLESRGRVRNVTLIAVNHIATLCAKKGRDEASVALLHGLSVELPRVWQLEMERDELARKGERDLVLEEDLEYELEMPLHAELIHTVVPYVETDEEKAAVKRTWTLDRVPANLEKQFSDFKDWRLAPLNYQRQGNAVVDMTAASDRGTTCRFLAYCHAEHDLPLSLEVFGCAQLAALAQSWLEELHKRGLMWSTLGTYCNSLCNLAGYWWSSDATIEEAALAMDVQPPDGLLRLRAQCESQSKQQQLYATKPDNWLEWDEAQKARVRCAEAWARAQSLPYDDKVALLKEYLVLLFHTVQPPDRVGIVRQLVENGLHPV